MQRSNSAEVIAVRQKSASRRLNSYVKEIIFAAVVVLCAATVSTLYTFVGGKTSGAGIASKSLPAARGRITGR
jgi:hypothetical protein